MAETSTGYGKGTIRVTGFRQLKTEKGFQLWQTGFFLWYPNRSFLALDATVADLADGSVVEGVVRFAYPFLAFGVGVAVAIVAVWTLFGSGAGLAALILWSLPYLLLLLAIRADGTKMLGILRGRIREIAVEAEDAVLQPSVEEPAGLDSDAQAIAYLAGLACFWGGFLLIATSLAGGRTATAGSQILPDSIAVPAMVLILAGSVGMALVQGHLLREFSSIESRTAFSTWRLIAPGTIAAAARVVGLNGFATVTALYGILVAGTVLFFVGVLSHG